MKFQMQENFQNAPRQLKRFQWKKVDFLEKQQKSPAPLGAPATVQYDEVFDIFPPFNKILVEGRI